MTEKQTKFKETEIGMIPEDWEETIFSEAIDVNPKRELKKGQTAKFVSMADVLSFQRKIANFVNREFKGGSKFQNGDTLFARITPCLENGKTAFVDILNEGEIGFGSTEFIVLSGKESMSDNYFVYYLSRSPEVRNITIKSMTGTSGRQRVETDVFDTIITNLPPLPEQRAIAKILSDLDAKIELNQQINKILEEIGKAIFKHWFVDFEFPNEEGKPYKSSGGEMVYNEELGKEIPKGWRVGFLGDLIHEKRVKIGDRNAQVLSAIKTGELVHSEDFFMKQVFSKNINKYLEVCMFDFAYNPARINIGSIGMLKENILGAVSPAYVVFSCRSKSHYFIEQMLKLSSIKKQIIQFCSGTVRQILEFEGISKIKLIIPNENLFIKYNEVYEGMLFQKDFLNSEIQTLSQIRDALLPKLMSGKIRVPLEGENG